MGFDTSYFRRSIVRQILGLLFFVFGVASIVWLEACLRIFSDIFGCSVLTTINVLVVFFLGMAFGAIYLGKKADAKKTDIHQLLKNKFLLSALTVFILLFLPLLSIILKATYSLLGDYFSYLKFFLIFILLFVPSSLIGGVFPIVSRYFIQVPHKISHEIGTLIGLLFAGVTMGSLLSSFAFFQIFGIKQSLALSAFLFLCCAFILKLLIKNVETKILLETDFFEKQLKLFSALYEKESRIFRKFVHIALVFLGFLFASFMLLWQRCADFVIGPKIFSSKILLSFTFTSISFGSFIYARNYRKHKKIYPGFALLPMMLSAFGVGLIVIFPALSVLNQNISDFFQFLPHWYLRLFIYVLNAVFIVLIPGMLIGIILVLANRISLVNLQKRAFSIGVNQCLFCLGIVLGLVLTGTVLLPIFGIQKLMYVVALSNFIIGLIIVLAYSFKYQKIRNPALVFGLVFLLAALSFFIPQDFLQKIYTPKANHEKLVYAKEGLTSTVTIHHSLQANYLYLSSNGFIIGDTPEKFFLVKQILSHLPLLLHPQPDSVLLIGFGEGKIKQRALLHQVKILDCVDNSNTAFITPSIFSNSSEDYSSEENFNLICMNEISYLKYTNRKYQVIISNCFHPGYSGMSTFFTKEFYQACRNRLVSTGILAVPIPLYGLTIEDLKILLRTFYEIFPSTTMWFNNNSFNRHILLLGSKNGLNKINAAQIELRIKDAELAHDLSTSGLNDIFELWDCFLMGSSEINKLTLGVQTNNNNKPVVEFSAAKTEENPHLTNHILQLLKSYREPIFPYLLSPDTTIEAHDKFRKKLDEYFKSSDLILEAFFELSLSHEDQAISFFQQAYMLNRSDKTAKKFLNDYFDAILIASPSTPYELTENAKIFFQKIENDTAITLLQKAIALNDQYAPAYFALGLNYEITGDFASAKQMYQKTLLLKPDLQNVQGRLNKVEKILDMEMLK